MAKKTTEKKPADKANKGKAKAPADDADPKVPHRLVKYSPRRGADIGLEIE